MRHLDLFSGIGGFALAAESVWSDNYKNVGFCDNEPFAQAILKKHWPHATIHSDIKEFRTPPAADLITGGFPCQPFSAAGKRRGTADDRHLWPEMLRVIRVSAPRWVIGENVGGLITWNNGMVLDQVCTDLEAEGYEVWPFIIPACAVNAPHRRDRVWIVAYSSSYRNGRKPRGIYQEKRGPKPRNIWEPGGSDKIRTGTNSDHQGQLGRGYDSGTNQKGLAEDEQIGQETRGPATRCSKNSRNVANPDSRRLQRHQREGTKEGAATCGSTQTPWEQNWLEVATQLCAVDDGLPKGLARPKNWRYSALKGAGNAIVPQVAAQIMLAIREADPSL